LAAPVLLGWAVGCAHAPVTAEAEEAPLVATTAQALRAPEPPRGAFTCDFALPGVLPASGVPTVTERDRMYMAARPGMVNKHLPIRLPEGEGGRFYSGGRYLFDTVEHAAEYKAFVVDGGFVLDGVPFLERPYIIEPDCHAWTVLGARDFGGDASHALVRTERWLLPEGDARQKLEEKWGALVREAQARGLTGVWLLYSPGERLASVVAYARKGTQAGPPDFESLSALERAPSFGEVLGLEASARTFDRAHFVLSIWYPFAPGDHGRPSLWPNSPPLPMPTEDDGLCDVSRGETHQTSPKDCPLSCGNALAEPGENNVNCPGDVRL
jgi:hypothetical protein